MQLWHYQLLWRAQPHLPLKIMALIYLQCMVEFFFFVVVCFFPFPWLVSHKKTPLRKVIIPVFVARGQYMCVYDIAPVRKTDFSSLENSSIQTFKCMKNKLNLAK